MERCVFYHMSTIWYAQAENSCWKLKRARLKDKKAPDARKVVEIELDHMTTMNAYFSCGARVLWPRARLYTMIGSGISGDEEATREHQCVEHQSPMSKKNAGYCTTHRDN